MVKLVSFVVFVAAFIWTWFLFNSESKINVGLHAGLQSKLAIMIENTIKNAKPNTSKFQMLRMYTETIDENKIKAHFAYKYSESLAEKETTDQTVSGEAVLNRSISENPDEQRWIVQNVKADNSTIEFQEGLVIGPNTETPATSPQNTTTTAPVEEKKTE